MITYQVLHGLDLQGATGLPSIAPTPEGKAMGAIPGWKMLMDPGRNAGQTPRNRVIAGQYINRNAGATAPFSYSTFANGAPSLDFSGLENSFRPQMGFNPTAWSLFSVARLESGWSGTPDIAYSSGPGSRDESPHVRLGLNNAGTRASMYSAGTSVRVAYEPPETFENRTALVIYTFSTRDGCRIYHNGDLGAHNPSDKEPLAGGYGAGQWALYVPAWVGKVGMTGLLDIDLGWPEHAGYRRAIERFLMDKYGIG